jgi:vancomycin resistance protein YoaR
MRLSGRIKLLSAGLIGLSAAAIFLAAGGNGILRRWQKGVNHGVTLEGAPLEGMLHGEVSAYVEKLAQEINRLPRNAYLDTKTGEFAAEVLGLQVDVATTVQKIMNAPAHSYVLLELIQLDPKITMHHYQRIKKEIGAYRTWIGAGNGGRATNIILATASLNNYIMMPGDLFSFNQANGPRTVERGYRLAPVVGGMGIGGGVCQVSTTLYNAVLRSGLEVVERYPHSVPVYYVPPGMDATVSDWLDFKFRNNTDHIIMIKTSTLGGSIDICILQD